MRPISLPNTNRVIKSKTLLSNTNDIFGFANDPEAYQFNEFIVNQNIVLLQTHDFKIIYMFSNLWIVLSLVASGVGYQQKNLINQYHTFVV